jgi:hypothetical protein
MTVVPTPRPWTSGRTSMRDRYRWSPRPERPSKQASSPEVNHTRRQLIIQGDGSCCRGLKRRSRSSAPVLRRVVSLHGPYQYWATSHQGDAAGRCETTVQGIHLRVDSSGSRVSAIDVEPTTSQKSIVTMRRSPCIARPARAASSLVSVPCGRYRSTCVSRADRGVHRAASRSSSRTAPGRSSPHRRRDRSPAHDSRMPSDRSGIGCGGPPGRRAGYPFTAPVIACTKRRCPTRNTMSTGIVVSVIPADTADHSVRC